MEQFLPGHTVVSADCRCCLPDVLAGVKQNKNCVLLYMAIYFDLCRLDEIAKSGAVTAEHDHPALFRSAQVAARAPHAGTALKVLPFNHLLTLDNATIALELEQRLGRDDHPGSTCRWLLALIVQGEDVIEREDF